MSNEEAIIDIRENIQPIVGGKSLDIAISALDLITHQQAELENLKVENQSLRSAANSLKMHYEEAQAEIENYKYLDVILHTAIDVTANIKSEAVKNFAERLKERVYKGGIHPTVEDEFMCDIDTLVKEMVGENNDL